MESVTRVWLVHRESGVIYPGAYLPDIGYFFVRPFGCYMITPDQIDKGRECFDVVMQPRCKDEPLPQAVHDSIMDALPEGVEPKPYTP
jgi:hypothetical protein